MLGISESSERSSFATVEIRKWFRDDRQSVTMIGNRNPIKMRGKIPRHGDLGL
jgi:hypothetical protein